MPSMRILPVRAAALRSTARIAPARNTQPFVNQVRWATKDQQKYYEPNDGGKGASPAREDEATGKIKLDGSSTASGKQLWVYAGITVAVLGAYGFMMGRPDTVTKKGIEHNTDAMHNMIPSDKQRQGGPIRSA